MLTNKTKPASSASSGMRNWVTGYVTVSLALLLTTPVFSGSARQDRKFNQEPRRREFKVFTDNVIVGEPIHVGRATELSFILSDVALLRKLTSPLAIGT